MNLLQSEVTTYAISFEKLAYQTSHLKTFMCEVTASRDLSETS